jgi:glycosyltransferase involved in cell wall biosynthesis
MEAMAMGIPVVASRVAGIPELVVEDQTGLLFTPSNWSELAQQLSKLLSNPELQRRLADAGKAKVHKSHNVLTAFTPLIQHLGATGPKLNKN